MQVREGHQRRQSLRIVGGNFLAYGLLGFFVGKRLRNGGTHILVPRQIGLADFANLRAAQNLGLRSTVSDRRAGPVANTRLAGHAEQVHESGSGIEVSAQKPTEAGPTSGTDQLDVIAKTVGVPLPVETVERGTGVDLEGSGEILRYKMPLGLPTGKPADCRAFGNPTK